MSADIDVVAGPSGAVRPERQDNWPLNLLESLRRSPVRSTALNDRPLTEARP